MSTRRKPTPSYLPHSASGRARAVWTDSFGIRRDRLLPGPFDSPQSRTAFATLLLELETSPHSVLNANARPNEPSVNEVVLAFLDFSESHYVRADGSTTHEVSQYRVVARFLCDLYGISPASRFGPLAFKSVRQRFIDTGWCRSLVNQRANRIRRIFKWAVAEELVPPAVHQALAAVPGLQRGRSKVRDTAAIEPVADERVDATLPFLPRHVRGITELQRLTGCRPGEACAIRRDDLDMSGTVWLYRPLQHKGSWRGQSRVIALGPKAQVHLKEFFTPNLSDYLFSPRLAVDEFHARRTAERKTPLYPSHLKRNASKRIVNPKRKPAEIYNVTSYDHAIIRACDKAFPVPAQLAKRLRESKASWWARLTVVQKSEVKSWHKAHRWHPNQLRHSFATKVRRDHGLEAAQVALGHAKADVTQLYAERNLDLAVDVALKIG